MAILRLRALYWRLALTQRGGGFPREGGGGVPLHGRSLRDLTFPIFSGFPFSHKDEKVLKCIGWPSLPFV